MGRLFIILLGLIALAILAYFCINKHAPIIEDDLATRTQLILDENGNGFARVAVDGRELILTGIAPDEAAREGAGELARDVYGVHTVDNQLMLSQTVSGSVFIANEPASRTEPEPVPYFEVRLSQPLDTQPAAQFPTAASPYRTAIVYKDGKVILTGLVADESSRLWLVTKAKEQFGSDNVDDQTKIDYGAPQGWHTTIESSLINLAILDHGEVSLIDNNLVVTGIASTLELADQVESDILEDISSAHKATIDIGPDRIETAVKSSASLDSESATKMSDPVTSCQLKFNNILSGKRILFDTDEAVIKSESYKLLDQLVAAAKQCPKSSIEVGGHTDSVGPDAYNQWLSESRAKAVADYLKKHGITSNRLSAKGYGELKPIADNSTEEGLAKNRRIEFKVGKK